MAEISKSLNLPRDMSFTFTVKYALFLPGNACWVFDRLDKYAHVEKHGDTDGMYWPPDQIYVPLDLITAARLNLIRPGDDSGVGDEQWAWMKLIGLVGETQ